MSNTFDGRATLIRRPLYWVASVAAVTIAVFASANLITGDGRIIQLVLSLPLSVVAGLLALSLVNYVLRSIRWYFLSRAIGVEVGFGRSTLYFIAGFALTMTPGKIGEALRLFLLRRHGYVYARTACLLVGDRMCDAAALYLLSMIGLAWTAEYVWLGVLSGVALLAAMYLFLRPAYMLAGVSLIYGRLRRWPRTFARIRTALRQAVHFGSWSVCGGALALSLAGWLAEGLAFHVLLSQLGAEISPFTAIFIFCFSMLVGGVAMLPGGLGSTEVSMAGLLIAAGVDVDASIVATGVIRVTTLWFAVGLGFAAMPMAFRRSRPPALATVRPT